MKIITFKNRGNFSKTDKFFVALLNRDYLNVLDKYGEIGCRALSEATPEDTGKTASCWEYGIEDDGTTSKITFYNTNIEKGANIAILLQYGHGTRNGGYYQGVDYINPTLKPIFDKIAKDAWEEVTRL